MKNFVRNALRSTCDRHNAIFNSYFPRLLAIFNFYLPRPRLPEIPLTSICPGLLSLQDVPRDFDSYLPRLLESLTPICPGLLGRVRDFNSYLPRPASS